jgi:hypothetical protein
MHIAKLKDGPKRAMKLSQMILKWVLKIVWWKGRKWTHVKRFWGWNVFSPLQILTSSFYLWTLRDFLFPSSFFQYFLSLSLSFAMLRLFEDLGILMIKEEENTLEKNLFRWNGMEWLSFDYGNGGVVDILVVDAYSGMELCTPILLGGARKKFWTANHFWKISKLAMDTSLNKAQHKQELLCG